MARKSNGDIGKDIVRNLLRATNAYSTRLAKEDEFAIDDVDGALETLKELLSLDSQIN
jgi:hypothetical protein